MSFVKCGPDHVLLAILYELKVSQLPHLHGLSKSCKRIVVLRVGGEMATHCASFPALRHLETHEWVVGASTEERQRLLESLETTTGPSGSNRHSDSEGNMSPPVGRQARTVTKAVQLQRQPCIQRTGRCQKQRGIEGKLVFHISVSQIWDFVDQEYKN